MINYAIYAKFKEWAIIFYQNYCVEIQGKI